MATTVSFNEADKYSFVTDGRTVEDMLTEQVGWEQVSGLVCDDLSNMYQAMGFHGFKRCERYEAREESEEARCLRKLLFDVAGVRTTVNINYTALPATATLRVLMGWKLAWYEANLARLSAIMKAAHEQGAWSYMTWLQDALDCTTKKHKNMAKWIQELSIVGWENYHHIMIINKKIHRKYKCKEKEQGYDIE